MSTATTFQRQWAQAVLEGVKAPVTNSNINALVAWQNAEGGPSDNPLNTTIGQGNVQGSAIKGYGSVQAGVNATVQTLSSSSYTALVNALRKDAGFAAIGGAIVNSPWDGKNHYANTDFRASVQQAVNALTPSAVLKDLGYTPSDIRILGTSPFGQRAANQQAAEVGLPDPFAPNWEQALAQDLLPLGVIAGAAALPLEAGVGGAADEAAAALPLEAGVGGAADEAAAGDTAPAEGSGGGSGPGSTSSAPIGSLAKVLEAATATGAIAALVQWVVKNWLRIVEFIAGAVLGVFGIYLLGKAGMKEA